MRLIQIPFLQIIDDGIDIFQLQILFNLGLKIEGNLELRPETKGRKSVLQWNEWK